jgi:hypothetical protein
MSKVAIQGDPSGSGTFTIAAPNSNNNRTLNLPDNAGTILTSASNLAGVTGVGKVLQVVQASTTTEVSTSSNSYTDSNLSASITPSSASSKILVLVNQSLTLFSSSTTDIRARFQLLRGSTSIFSEASANAYRIRAALASGELVLCSYYSISVLDTPNTTASITYKTQIGNTNSTLTVAQSGSEKSFITLMEIAA